MRGVTYIMQDAYNHNMQLSERGLNEPSLNRHEFEIVNDYKGKGIKSEITGQIAICDENFDGYNFLIESDEDTLDNQLVHAFKLFKEGKVARIVYSGSKSFHCIIHCNENITDKNERQYIFDRIRKELFNGCTCDVQNKNAARKTRRPHSWRELSIEQVEKFMKRYEENPMFAKLVDSGIIKTMEYTDGKYYVMQTLIKEDWNNVLNVSEWRKDYEEEKMVRIRKEALMNSRRQSFNKKGDWHNLPAVKVVLHTGKGSRDADLNKACYSMKNNGYESEISILIDEVEGVVGYEIAQKFRRQYC